MQEVTTMHEKFLKVYLSAAPEAGKCICQPRLRLLIVYLPAALTYEKSKFALTYSNGKAMPRGFSHFYCHRVVLSIQKNFEVFFNISGRLVAAR